MIGSNFHSRVALFLGMAILMFLFSIASRIW